MLINKRIIFRADGNARIGMGHIVRCQALANMLGNFCECVFAMQDPDPEFIANLQQNYINTIALPLSEDYEEEGIKLTLILEPSDLVVLDGYKFNTSYQQKLKENGHKVVCLDDIHAFPFVADAIINQAGGIVPELYQVEAYTKLYLGVSYAMLRDPFLQAASQGRQAAQTKNILLNMGGADPDNQTLHLLESVLVNLKELSINVVIGAAYAHQDKLQAFIENKTNITVHRNLDAEAMCRLMQSCDAAILPPSSVSYEWCSVSGLLFVHQIADNQKDLRKFLIQNGLAFPLAELRTILNHSEKNNLITEQINRQREYFDGKSKSRLQRIFFDLILPENFGLRKAEASDCQILFDWINDPEVRQQSFNPAPIPLQMHERWFSSKLNNPDCLILIAEVAGIPAGMIRYDFQEQEATISFLLNKDYRGKGLGPLMLTSGTTALQLHRAQASRLLGYVQKNNLASILSFQRAGFSELPDVPASEPNSLVFAKTLK